MTYKSSDCAHKVLTLVNPCLESKRNIIMIISSKFIKKAVVASVTILVASITFAADNGENVIYLGGGKSAKDDLPKSDTAMNFGYLRLNNANDNVFGFDIAQEGTKLDSTWGQYNAVKSGTSYNVILGRNIARNDSYRFDAGVILGMREKSEDCPSSYLGYQCYADQDPNIEYAFNYGLLATISYKSVTFGLRATGASTQAIIGIRF